MNRRIVKFVVPVAFVVSVIIAIMVYISIHNNKEAAISLDYTDLQGLEYSNKSQSYWNTDGALDVAAAENGYYYVTTENMLVYFDIETKDVVPVCAKPECLHDTYDCNAYLGQLYVFDSIYYYNGYVYYMPVNNGMAELCRMDASGSSREIVGQLLPSEATSAIHLAFNGDYAYAYNFTSHISSEEEFTEELVELSLKDGTRNIVYSVTGKGLAVKNVKSFGDKVFFIVQESENFMDKNKMQVRSRGLYSYSHDNGVNVVSENNINDYYILPDEQKLYYYVTGEGLYVSDISSETSQNIYASTKEVDMCSVSSDGRYIYLSNAKYAFYVYGKEQWNKLRYIVLDKDGNVVNDIKCDYALELYFGDERFLFCRGMGQDQLMYIDKKDIENASEWNEIFNGGIDLINWSKK